MILLLLLLPYTINAFILPKETKRTRLSWIKFVCKCLLFGDALLLGSVAGFCISVGCQLKLFGSQPTDANHYTGRVFYWLCLKLLDIRVKVDGIQNLKEGVIVANHQSALDLVSMAGFFTKNTVVIVKDSLKYIPFLGQHLWMSGNIFIKRPSVSPDAKDRAKIAMTDAGTQMKQKNVSIFMFPEGTRHAYDESEQKKLLPFKKGAFILAQVAGCHVVPVVISDYSTFFSFKNMYFFDNAVIKVTVLDPVECVEVDQTLMKVQKQMQEQLEK